MNRALLGIPVLCAAALAAALLPSPTTTDYTTIPPDPAVISKELASLEISVTRAIEIAQKEVGGLASSIRLSRSAPPTAFEVELFTSKVMTKISVDAHSGKTFGRTDTPRFPGAAVSGEWIELSSGLKYYELSPGNGASPTSTKSNVRIDYTAWLVDGTRFDSTLDTRIPFETTLNKVMKGLEEGVLGMKVGGKRKLIIPYDLAYGVGGKPPQVPGKATIIFDVELLAVL